MIATALAALLIGLTATLGAALGAKRVVLDEARARFDRLNERLSEETARRVNQTRYGLFGARGLFIASEHVDRDEFAAHIAQHDLAKEFPGAIGFGFIERVRRSELDDFVRRERESGEPDFRVFGLAPEASPLSEMPDLYVIRYCFPRERNANAWGLDVGSELERRLAAERAMRTGEASISGRITLVQDGKRQTAFLYYLPIYEKGADTSTPQLREQHLVGLAYAPIILSEALHGTSESLEGNLAFDIFDGPITTVDRLLSDKDGGLIGIEGYVDNSFYDSSRYTARTSLQIGGRTWTMVATSTPTFEASIDFTTPILIAKGGALLSFLGAGFVLSLLTSRQRALSLAQSMTSDLAKAKVIAEEAQAVAKMRNWSYDLKTGTISWSKQLYGLCERDESLGTPDFDGVLSYYDEPSAETLAACVKQAAIDGTPYTLILRSGTGSGKYVRAEGRARKNRKGQVVELFGTATDVTKEIAAAESLRKAQEQAEAANRAKSAFLANMSHEIRTPLTAILGFTDLLRDSAETTGSPAQRADAIDTIHTASNHLLTIINDILDISKIEAEKMSVESIETPIPAILLEVETLLSPRATGKGVHYSTQLSTPLPDRVLSDPTRFRQILMNLAGNAVKFTEHGSITVTASQQERDGKLRLIVDIRDTGRGIAPEQSETLFNPFEQENETVSRRYGGTGLGLTISRRLAELMGGSVRLIDTEHGKGSCFRIELPLTPLPDAIPVTTLDQVKAKIEDKDRATTSKPLKGRILLVEDGVDNQRLIAFHLRKAGATVEIADNRRIALDLIDAARASRQPFDLIITDMQMPEMDGYTLAQSIRQSGDTVPIIALTAHAMPEDRRKCEAAGCDDYATKPIDKALLVETAARWLTTPEQRLAA